MRVEFKVLGPLGATQDRVEIPLGSRKQRAVLAILLLHANEVVPVERLIDELWGEDPPPSAAHTLQVYVSRLRKTLHPDGESNGLLLTRPGGYLLRVGPDELDLHRFDRLVEEGRRELQRGSPQSAAEKLDRALSLWRGSALADIGSAPFARIEIERLHEQRLSVLEDKIEAGLALGRHAQVVPELERLVAQHPLRERTRGQLMLALYRCGRQADALAVYRDGCRHLREELGLEPTKELQRLQGAILRQDDSLDLRSLAATGNGHLNSETALESTGDVTAAPKARSRSSRLLRASFVTSTLIVATVLVSLFTLLVLRENRDDQPVTATVDANSAAFIDPEASTITGRTGPLGRPAAIAAGGGSVWVTDPSGNQVLRLDPATRHVVDRIPIGQGPTDIAVAGGSIWVVDPDARNVYQIDTDSDTVVATIPVGNGSTAIAAGEGAIWVTDAIDGTIIRIDPVRARIAATIRVAQPLTDVAAGLGSVWATSSESGLLLRVDPDANRVIQTFAVGNGPASIALTEEAVWVANPPDATISRIDPRAGIVRKVAVADPGTLASVRNMIWVAEPQRLDLVIVDARSRAITGRIPIGSSPTTLAPIGRTVAVLTAPSPAAHRGGTLRVVGGEGLDSIDPGTAWSAIGWSLTSLTNEGLVRYARAAGSAGAVITPDLATEVPAPQAGGRVFVFHLRPGLRYSTGAPVRPEDFRIALERQYEAGTGLAALGVPLVGGERCDDRPVRCDLSRAVSVDGDDGTITFHLSSPDPGFLHKLALPFASPLPDGLPPIGTLRSLPSTGPYFIERYSPGRRVVLARNPYFRPTPANAQEGFADRITVKLGLAPSQQAAAVGSGAADLMLDSPPSDKVASFARRAPLRLHTYTMHQVLALFLNTRIPPFDRPAARRALNFGVDRAVIVQLAGGSEFAQATCQILSSGLPGYKPFCPYSLASNGGGLWRGPNLDRARRMVERSGTTGMPVTVWSVADDPLKLRIAHYAVGLLDRLGYRARLRLYPSIHPYYARVGLARRRSQLGVIGWQADYPAASSLFPVLFSCESYRPGALYNMNPAGFCSRRVDDGIRRAAALESADPAASAEIWQRVDRQVTRGAPWVPLVNVLGIDFVSERVGNYQRSPAFGILLDRLWVR